MRSQDFQLGHGRRLPAMGVGGVTLLMLVTLVLTSSPALARGRDLAPVTPSSTDALGDRSAPTTRAEERVGGRRECASRRTRPSSGFVALSVARTNALSIDSHRPALSAVAHEVGPFPTDRVRVMLLNLPPPRLA